MSNVHTVNSIVSNRNRDCFECRMLSGGGLVAAGLYVCHHSKQYQHQAGKAAMYSVASGTLRKIISYYNYLTRDINDKIADTFFPY